jgi:hypothetical protein
VKFEVERWIKQWDRFALMEQINDAFTVGSRLALADEIRDSPRGWAPAVDGRGATGDGGERNLAGVVQVNPFKLVKVSPASPGAGCPVRAISVRVAPLPR